jgi:prepilin-type N-terminal cleavage/methylation domain-containing protein
MANQMTIRRKTDEALVISGFTIVELLIVIVVIGILAAITIIAYNGVQNKANDAAIRSDLRTMGAIIEANRIVTDAIPQNEAGLSTLGLKATKRSYGGHLVDAGTGYKYNTLYCSTISSYRPADFAIVSSSTSTNVYSFHAGTVATFASASWVGAGWGTICPAILGVTAGDSNAGVWLYENSIWKSWLP